MNNSELMQDRTPIENIIDPDCSQFQNKYGIFYIQLEDQEKGENLKEICRIVPAIVTDRTAVYQFCGGKSSLFACSSASKEINPDPKRLVTQEQNGIRIRQRETSKSQYSETWVCAENIPIARSFGKQTEFSFLDMTLTIQEKDGKYLAKIRGVKEEEKSFTFPLEKTEIDQEFYISEEWMTDPRLLAVVAESTGIPYPKAIWIVRHNVMNIGILL